MWGEKSNALVVNIQPLASSLIHLPPSASASTQKNKPAIKINLLNKRYL